MKKQLLVAAVIAAFVGSSAFALVDNRRVKNSDKKRILFVAWKSSKTGAKSTYERILPGKSKTFGLVDRGYGMNGLYGNVLVAEWGPEVENVDTYRKSVEKTNTLLDPELTAIVSRDDKGQTVIKAQ